MLVCNYFIFVYMFESALKKNKIQIVAVNSDEGDENQPILSAEYPRVKRSKSAKIPDAANSGPAAAPLTIKGEVK